MTDSERASPRLRRVFDPSLYRSLQAAGVSASRRNVPAVPPLSMVRGPIERHEKAPGGPRQWPAPPTPLIGLAGPGIARWMVAPIG